MRIRSAVIAIALVTFSLWSGLPMPLMTVHAATVTVTSCNESGLTTAIGQAQSGDTVVFASACSMTLTSAIGINKTLTIDGNGNNVTIDGQSQAQIFVVATDAVATSPITFTLNGVTLTHGGNGAIDRGGAIYVPQSGSGGGGSSANIVVNNVTFVSNTTAHYGAAIESDFGNVTVNNSTFSNNQDGTHGGAINNNEVPPAANQPQYSMTLSGDTFTGNTSGDGGAIALGSNSPASIINSTFANNSGTTDGDAILTYAPVQLLFTTIANNTGAGAGITFGDGGGSYTLRGTILANNGSGGALNCTSTFANYGDSSYNLAYPNSTNCLFSASSTVGDPKLGSLQDNGGPTQTMALGASSAAIGLMKVCQDVAGTRVAVDQRGVARRYLDCDTGAYEAPPSGSNLVFNGSFENPALPPGGNLFSTSGIPGWSVCSGPDMEVEGSGLGAAQDGSQFLELNSDGPSGACQTISTVPGQTYQLTFYFAGRPGYGPSVNQMDVKWGSTDLTATPITADGTQSGTTVWTRYTYDVIPTSGATTIRFTDVGDPQTNGCFCGSLLDNVQLTSGNQAPLFTPGENGASTWGGTASNPFLVTGTATPSGTVTLYGSASCGGSPIGTATADSSGKWSISEPNGSGSTLSAGTHTLTANVTVGSSTSACSSPIAVLVDRTAPSSTVTFPSLVPNTPYLNASGWTAGCGTPSVDDICGTAVDSSSGVAAVFLAIENSSGQFWNGTNFSTSGAWVKANGTTNWSIAVPRPTDGVYTVASAAIDNAGNTEAIFGTSIYGICDVSGTGGQLSLNGGQLSLNGGLCTVDGQSGGSSVSGQLSLNGGQLSLNGGTGGQLSLNGGQLSLNGGQLSLNGGTCTVRDNTGTSGTLTITGGTLSSSGGQLSLNGGQLSLNGGLQVTSGQLSLNGGQLSLNGGLSVTGGQLSLNGGDCTFTAGSTSGQLSLNGGQLSLNGGQLSLNGGQLSLNGGQLSLNGGQLSLNGGQLSLNGGAGASSELGNVVVDSTAPIVSNFTVDGQSLDGAVNINPGSTFHIRFNESMNCSTVNGTTITVTPSAGTPSCDTGDTTGLNASFTGLQPSRLYTVTVSGPTSGATDLAGNPITPATFHFSTAAASPPNTRTDSDGDGIPDAWDGTTTPTFTNLTSGGTTNTLAWNFSSTSKDLCVVENYMNGPAADGQTYNQAISQAANQLIVNAFQRHGIHLIIFEGDAAHSAGLPGSYLGPYFGGSIPMIDPLGNTTNGAFDWGHGNSGHDAFDTIRNRNFVPTGLVQFCHYAVIAHSLGGTTSTGSSRGFGASDLVIALKIGDNGVGNTMQQAGTLMHELGHNLGLHHGGGVAPGTSNGQLPSDIDTNHKPNYLSVMNYSYQFTGVLQTASSANNQTCSVGGQSLYCMLDYSESALPPLDKTNLNEPATTGLGSGAAGYAMKHECTDPNSSTGYSNVLVLNAMGPIDWNCDHIINPGSVVFNVDGDSTRGPSTLNGSNDWADLNFLVGTIGLGADNPDGVESQGPEPVTSTIDVDPSESGGIATPDTETTAPIQPAVPTITWNNPAGITYGTALSGAQLNASANIPGTFSYSPAIGTVLNPGTQTLTALFIPSDTADFAPKTITATINVTYQASGTCNGDAGHAILQPINADGSSVFKQGSTVAAKFRVCDVNGKSVGTAGVVSSFKLIQTISSTVSTAVNEAVDSSTPDTAFRWDSTNQQWIYNVSTKSLSANTTYVYTITLNDGSTIQFQFGLK